MISLSLYLLIHDENVSNKFWSLCLTEIDGEKRKKKRQGGESEKEWNWEANVGEPFGKFEGGSFGMQWIINQSMKLT